MKLNVYVNEMMKQVDVPNDMLREAESIYEKIDKDLDQGWQMSREWMDNLDTLQRCKVIADRLLTAIENDNYPSTMLMAGYIMTRMPHIKTVHIATDGDINQTHFVE